MATRVGIKQRKRVSAPVARVVAPEARPFVKWVGGKRQLLEEIRRNLPAKFGAFHEPFIGGGALFFAQRPRRAVLGDMNERLVRTYRGVRDEVDAVVKLLRSYPHDRDFFLELRASAIDERSDAEVAAWFIYLNRTGFNGLYRVNRKNRFNVPFGDNANPTICDEENLRACSKALQKAEVHCEDFAAVLRRAKRSDVVYFDPPYVPLSATSQFTAYTAGGFGMDAQVRLRDVALELKRRGVHVLLSNSDSPVVHELYADFERTTVLATRAINSVATGRGRITELLIR